MRSFRATLSIRFLDDELERHPHEVAGELDRNGNNGQGCQGPQANLLQFVTSPKYRRAKQHEYEQCSQNGDVIYRQMEMRPVHRGKGI